MASPCLCPAHPCPASTPQPRPPSRTLSTSQTRVLSASRPPRSFWHSRLGPPRACASPAHATGRGQVSMQPGQGKSASSLARAGQGRTGKAGTTTSCVVRAPTPYPKPSWQLGVQGLLPHPGSAGPPPPPYILAVLCRPSEPSCAVLCPPHLEASCAVLCPPHLEGRCAVLFPPPPGG